VRYRNWRSDARFVVQFVEPLSIAELFSGARSQIAIDREPITYGRPNGYCARTKRPQEADPASGSYCRLRMTLFTRGRKPRHVTWPIFVHRPFPDMLQFPDKTRIQKVIVTRRRRAHEWSWHAVFHLRVPKQIMSLIRKPAPDKNACGIDVGWRMVEDGLRVATLADSQGGREFLVLPKEIIEAVRHHENLQGERDKALAALLPTLRAVDWEIAPSPLGSLARPVRATKLSPESLYDLVLAWRKMPEWAPEALAQADAWLSEDKIRNQYLVNTRRRALARRLDIYRNAAKRWTERYGVIGIEDLDLKTLLAKETPDGKPQDAVRWYAKLAAPGLLLATIRHAASKTGSRVHEHDGKSTWPCAACRKEGRNTVVTPSDPAALIQSCPHGHVWDQDENAADNLLAAALASGSAPPEDQAPLAA
jgi:transposase